MKEKKFYNIDPQVKVAMLMKAPDTDLLNVAISDTGMQPSGSIFRRRKMSFVRFSMLK